jgi:hypothetical protein
VRAMMIKKAENYFNYDPNEPYSELKNATVSKTKTNEKKQYYKLKPEDFSKFYAELKKSHDPLII